MMVRCWIILVFVLLFFSSCENKRKDAVAPFVKEWTGRAIKNVPLEGFIQLRGDSIMQRAVRDYEYAIVSYIDASEAESCNLHLFEWAKFIHEVDSITNGRVPCILVVHPRNKHEFVHILKHYGFRYPVYIDEKGEFNKSNSFPSNRILHTFLVDGNNKVLFVGSPIQSIRIKKAFIDIIDGQKVLDTVNEIPLSDATITPEKVDLGEIQHSMSVEKKIRITNEGNEHLVIQDVQTSCGCMDVEYDKAPISKGDSSFIRIKYHATGVGNFHKTINVYCNTPSSPYKVEVVGVVNNNINKKNTQRRKD